MLFGKEELAELSERLIDLADSVLELSPRSSDFLDERSRIKAKIQEISQELLGVGGQRPN
jgi:hypothetical protein